jgi:hypothetical protein
MTLLNRRMANQMGIVGWSFLVATILVLIGVWSLPFAVARDKQVRAPIGLFIVFALIGTPFLGWVMALLHVFLMESPPDRKAP